MFLLVLWPLAVLTSSHTDIFDCLLSNCFAELGAKLGDGTGTASKGVNKGLCS